MKAARMGAGAVKAAPELTPWAPVATPPSIIGVYEVETEVVPGILSAIGFAYWGGKQFSVSVRTPSAADKCKRYAGRLRPVVAWRGLAADPSKAVAK
jgi:hypothetical protein